MLLEEAEGDSSLKTKLTGLLADAVQAVVMAAELFERYAEGGSDAEFVLDCEKLTSSIGSMFDREEIGL